MARREHRPDPRHELGVELARGDVVGAALERAHALDGVGACVREHDHRDVAVPATAGLALPQPRAELGLAREHDVGRDRSTMSSACAAPPRLEHVEAVRAQVPLQVPRLVRVGIGQEKRSTHGPPG